MNVHNANFATRSKADRLIARLTSLKQRKTRRYHRRRIELLCQVAEEVLSPAQLRQVADSVEEELHRLGHLSKRKPGQGALMRAIDAQLEPLGFPTEPEERQQVLQDVLAESFRQRQALLADALSAPQVADLLQTSRQTPLNRVRKETLLAVYQNGKWLFPRWQFDMQGEDGVVTGLPQVLQALRVSPIEKLGWFLRRSAYLEDRTPLEALKAGETERVVGLAREVGRP